MWELLRSTLRLSGSTMRAGDSARQTGIAVLKWQESNALIKRCLLPGGLAVLKAQCQRFPAFDDFAGQYQVRSVLFDLGACDLNLLGGFKLYSHIVEKFLGTKKDLDCIRAALQRHIDDGLST